MKQLNKEELAYGFVFGASMAYWTHLWAIPTAVICAYLWARSGMEGEAKFWRRVLCPVIQNAALTISIQYSPEFIIASMAAGACATMMLSVGYGIPSTQPPDPGSVLGRYFFRLAKGNELIANLMIRGLIMSVIILAFALAAMIGTTAGRYQ